MAAVKIGFVGLGAMGGRLASRLVTAGDLTVFDASAEVLEGFRDRATLGTSIADVARDADIVGVCVRTDSQVNDCVEDLLPAMRAGSVLMIHSTVSPETVKAAAKKGAPLGIDVIDSAVTVTRYDNADAPFVFSMLVGNADAVERARPALESYSTGTVHVGEIGAGMGLKIINNLVTLVEILVAEEAFRLASVSGVPSKVLETVMRANGALTPTMAMMPGRTDEDPPDRATQIQREIQGMNGVKDLWLAEELAKAGNTPSAAATFAKTQYFWSMAARGAASA